MLFIIGLLGFVVIPNEVNKFRPASAVPVSANVSGNGSNAVMAGDYLYFINGYISVDSIKYKQNEYNKVKNEGAIYRIKMSNGVPEYDNSYISSKEGKGVLRVIEDEDWDDLNDYERHNRYPDVFDLRVKEKDLDLIVPKIAGWEQSALYIFGNTLVYTSPNNQKNRLGQLQRGRVDFFSVDLNGKKHRRIYTTRSDGVLKNDFTVVSISGKAYLLCHDGNRLVRVGMDGRVKEISNEVGSVALPVVSAYSDEGSGVSSLANSYAGMMGYVFYTETATEDDTVKGQSNIIMRYNIAADKKEKIRHDRNTHTMIMLANGTLMFRTDFMTPGEQSSLYLVGNETVQVNGVTTIVPATDDFSESNLHAKFRLRYENSEISMLLDSTNETPYFSGERTSPGQGSFSFVTHSMDNKLTVYKRVDETNSRINYVPDLDNVINDVSQVIQVTPGGILCKNSLGQVRYMSYSGDIIQNDPINDMPHKPDFSEVPDTMSAFQVVNKPGLGYMYFYIKTVNQKDGEGDDTITVPAIIDGFGKEYLLTRLDEKFIPEIV